jgi:hypothetical protein
MMKELFLLGAGASVEAGIPGSYKMTEKMVEIFSNLPYSRLSKVIRFVIGGLIFQRSSKGEIPYDGINIEDLFNAIQTLAERDKSELSAFIGSWNPMLEEFNSGEISSSISRNILNDIYKPLSNKIEEMDKTIDAAIKAINTNKNIGHINRNPLRSQPFIESNFRRKLTEAVRQVTGQSDGALFNQTNEIMIEQLINMIWGTDISKIEYLFPLIKYAHNNISTIATLNYDNCIELAGQACGIAVETGFESWSSTGEFSFSEKCLPLIKLHGSINWKLLNGGKSDDKPMSHEVIKQVDPDAEKNMEFTPAIIFGGRNKLTAKGPFLKLLSAFGNELSKSNKLTIIGYSFQDKHINEYINGWINGDTSRKLRIINPSFNKLDNEFITDIHSILSTDHGKTRVEILSKKTSEGLLELR